MVTHQDSISFVEVEDGNVTTSVGVEVIIATWINI